MFFWMILHAAIITLDETHLRLNGYVSKQNYRYWVRENPRELRMKPLHSQKVTVWCALSKVWIVGPYFFLKMSADKL